MDCRGVRFTRHAFERMFRRKVTPKEVSGVIAQGEVIASYPDDTPHPSVLILGFTAREPLHVVVARDDVSRICYVITVYSPDPEIWEPNLKTRRHQ
jgi:hypothetical protein